MTGRQAVATAVIAAVVGLVMAWSFTGGLWWLTFPLMYGAGAGVAWGALVWWFRPRWLRYKGVRALVRSAAEEGCLSVEVGDLVVALGDVVARDLYRAHRDREAALWEERVARGEASGK